MGETLKIVKAKISSQLPTLQHCIMSHLTVDFLLFRSTSPVSLRAHNFVKIETFFKIIFAVSFPSA